MQKIILKTATICLVILLLRLLPQDQFIVLCLHAVLVLVLFVLLMIVLIAVVRDLKLLQLFGLLFKKNKQKENFPAYLIMNYQDIDVSYSWPLNGGGIILAYEFVRVVREQIGKVEHVFEYCAGPGFIGFSLLANGLCDHLTLADVNPRAVEAIRETIKKNNLEGRVTVYASDCLDTIPQREKWDLVVGNPPWYLCPQDKNKIDIRVCDPGGQVHEKFFKDIGGFLKPEGLILFIEGREYTDVSCFRDMIEKNGLNIAGSFQAVSFLKIFHGLQGYQGISFSLKILLRLSLFFREAYFILAKKGSNL